jgi:plasmid maintenance system antidote protein VapI
LDQESLSAALEISFDRVSELLNGSIPLTIAISDRLSSFLGGTVEFWMARDSQYHADRARLAADEWVGNLPIREMSSLGWISTSGDWLTNIDACLRFFDVKDIRTWEHIQNNIEGRTLFRSSRTIESDDYAVAAWLRKCEVELMQVECADWDRVGFQALLPTLVPLTRIADPGKFLPQLTGMCAEVGVAVGVVRSLRGCPASGAARRLESGKRSVALSGRFRVDDQFWFTFFHEAAHLVMHDGNNVYLDALELHVAEAETIDEIEADQYAAELLVPPEYEDALASARRSPFELRRLAHEIGISTGIAVGHLQHRGLLGYNVSLNKLKHRYKWNGPNLERA